MTSTAPLHTARPTTVPAASRRSGSDLLRRLEREWDSLREDPVVLRRAEGWDLGVRLGSLDDVAAAAGWHRSAADRLAAPARCADGAETVLARLVVIARHDEVAARVVLHRLLPGLVHQARRWSMRHDGSPSALDELVAAAWLVIRTYRIERRTGPIVPSMLNDAAYHAFVRAGRRAVRHEPHPAEHFERLVRDHGSSSWDELHELLSSVLLGGRTPFTPTDRRLIGLLLAGCGPDEIAASLKVSVRTATNRRHDLISRLRAALLDEAA